MFVCVANGVLGFASFTVRLAPLALLVLPVVETVNLGANLSAAQFVTWNGTATGVLAASSLVMLPARVWGLQFVGLNVNPGRSMRTLTCLICSGIPSRICGIA